MPTAAARAAVGVSVLHAACCVLRDACMRAPAANDVYLRQQLCGQLVSLAAQSPGCFAVVSTYQLVSLAAHRARWKEALLVKWHFS